MLDWNIANFELLLQIFLDVIFDDFYFQWSDENKLIHEWVQFIVKITQVQNFVIVNEIIFEDLQDSLSLSRKCSSVWKFVSFANIFKNKIIWGVFGEI